VAREIQQDHWQVTLDKAAGTGTVEIEIDTASIDFGHAKLNEYVAGPEQLTPKIPDAALQGEARAFRRRSADRGERELSMHGVTRPVALKVTMFKCIRIRSSSASGAARTSSAP